MLIEVLVNLGSNDFPESPFKEGERHEVTEQLGKRLIGFRLAKDVTTQCEPVVEVEVPQAVAAPEAEKPAEKTNRPKGK